VDFTFNEFVKFGEHQSRPTARGHSVKVCFTLTVSPMLLPGEYKRGVGWTCHSDAAFCQITLVLVIIGYTWAYALSGLLVRAFSKLAFSVAPHRQQQ